MTALFNEPQDPSFQVIFPIISILHRALVSPFRNVIALECTSDSEVRRAPGGVEKGARSQRPIGFRSHLRIIDLRPIFEP